MLSAMPQPEIPRVELSGPFPDGKIGVHRHGESLLSQEGFRVAAKLRYVLGDDGKGAWKHSTRNLTCYDTRGKPIVDIEAAVQEANIRFPEGPEQKAA